MKSQNELENIVVKIKKGIVTFQRLKISIFFKENILLIRSWGLAFSSSPPLWRPQNAI